MTPTTTSLGLIPNLISQQPFNPPTRNDWDRLFQPMFDEYFNPPPRANSPVQVAATPRAVDIADSPVSTSIDQDAPSSSIPSTQEQEQSLIISQRVEESLKIPYFHDDPLHEDLTSQGSSSNMDVKMAFLNGELCEVVFVSQPEGFVDPYMPNHMYRLKKVIVNGDAPAITSASASTEGLIPPKTAKQKLARKNELKAKSTLLLAILDEHLLKFHGIKDIKTLWEAIKARFKGLDKTYDRFQKLINQLEIYGEVVSREGANLKLLRSLPLAWNNIALILRNKSDLNTLSMDDLYNNLKVYESEIKGKSSSSSNSHNVAFVSSENTSSTNEVVNTAYEVSTASSQGQASSSTYADDVMFWFFTNQSNSQQLENEDLKQIDTDDLEEMDLKWQESMLTIRVKRFLKKTGRNLNFNSKETVGFDKKKFECYNCHRKGYFARECKAPRNQGNRNRDALRRNALVDTSTTNALVVQDGIVHQVQNLSFRAEEGLTNSALMADTSQGSSSSPSSESEREALNKSKLEIIGYQIGLESLEARIVVHKKNEVVYEEDITFLKYDVQVKDISIKDLKNHQISAKDKAGLGYDSQMNESEVVHSVFDNRESNVDNSPVNDRFKTGKGFHAVLPPYTGNYMPLRHDLSFAGLDDYVYKIKDTDSDNDSVFRPKSDQTKPKFTKINFVKSDENVKSVNKENTHSFNHLIKDCDFHDNKMVEKPVLNNKGRVTDQREIRPVWNNAQRVNHQNKLTHPHPKRNFVPTSVATKSGQVPVHAAKQNSPRVATSISTASPVNTVVPKSKVDDALPKTYSYFKAHLPVRRAFNQKSAAKTNNLNEKVKTARVNNVTTAGPKAVVSAAVGNGENALKSSTCWIWRPTRNVIDHNSKDNGSYMLKRFDYIDLQGRLNSIIKRLMVDLLHLEEVLKEVKLLEKTECLILSLDFKLLDESQVLLKIPRQNNMYSFDLKNVVPSGEGKVAQSLLFSWVFFLATKDETSGILKTFITGIENQINHKVKIIRCDNRTEFKNNDINQFYGMKGIKREFSDARTPQQNRVAAKAVSIACYVHNRVLVTKPHNKTLYELLHGRPPSISFMRPFRCPVTILNTLDPLGKFDEKADEGFFIGYSINSKAFRVFNTRTRKVEENLHTKFLENKPNFIGSGPDWLFDIDLLTNIMNYEPVTVGNQTNKNAEDAVADDIGKKTNEEPANKAELDNLLAQQKECYAKSTNRDSTVSPFVSTAGQIFTNADDLLTDPLMPDLEDTADLLNTGIFSGAYDDEDKDAKVDLNNLETTMNVYRNKKYERGIVVRNKARLVSQGYTHEEDIEYDEMDVKSAFLYGTIEEEVYVCQPPSFEDPQFPDKVYKVEKALYGLHQAPRAWYETKFDFITIKTASTPIVTNKALLKDEEAEVLWIQNQMLDYGYNFMNTKIYIDNESTICVVKNPMFHSKTKHIEIRHHFIRHSYEKRLIQVIKIHTDHNVADLLTKAFDVSSIRDKFGNKTGSCKVNAARQSRLDGRTCNIKQKCVKSQTPRQAKRGQDTKIPQSGGPHEKVGDEAVYKELGDRMERAATTASSLEAE
ncbi:ribonuclease H-like domain-containing protein [Tanacetum coccineum]